MKLVVGLGNPGPEYVGTRHNAGFRVATALAARLGLSFGESPFRGQVAHCAERDLALLMPMTFMNRSGDSVAPAAAAYGVGDAELLVVFDDLDLPFGRLRLRSGGGCGGHRGMESIAAALGHEDFARLRFGIGRPPSGVEVIDYVLSPFDAEEEASLESVVDRAAEAALATFDRGIERAMEVYNRPADGESPTRNGSNQGGQVSD